MSSQPIPAPEWRVLPMRRSHLRGVLKVENSAYEFPWNERIFKDCLRAGYSAWVALADDDIVEGYAVMSMGAGEAHVLNVCVAPSIQRRGLGRQFMLHLMKIAEAAGSTTMLLEVRRSNHAAQRLYEQLGFVRIGLRRNYYPAVDGREDAWVLAHEFV